MGTIHISPHERLKKYALKDIDELYNDFHIKEGGLTQEQIEQMRKQHGSNHVGYSLQAHSFFQRIKRAFINPFSVILFVLAIVSFITDVCLKSNSGRNGTSVVIILSMLIISGMVRLIQERKAGHAADTLIQQIKTTVSVYRQGQQLEISSEELVVGDTVSLSAGERVPADLRLIEAQDLFVSQALLTGESNVLEKNTNRLASATQIPLDRFSNIAFMGSSVISGEGKGIVLAVGGSTVYGGYLSELQRNKHSFDTGANSIAWVLIRFMVALVPVVFVVSGITKGDWLTSFLFSLSVAVGLTPELLPMVINACLAKGSSAMGEKQTIVKNINALQSFGSMDVLCVDKTGTLTGDEVILEYYLDILGEESREVLDCAYLNSFYHTGVANHLDQAILKCSSMPGRENHFLSLGETIQKLDELPFDYERKCVSVLLSVPEKENYIITKGDVDSVYSRCQYVQHKGQTLKIDTADSGGIHAIVDEMTEDGMKVLAVAYKPVSSQSRLQMEDEAELILLGYVVFFDAPKSSAASALQKLEQLHVQVKVLTGDQKSVTLSICRRLGIETEHILTGEEMEELSEDEQLLAVEKTTVFSQLSPGQKSQIIRMLRENGHAVGFLGDGMNDLAAMTAADVGISVDTATQAAKESADVILLKKDLNVLEQGILEGRKAFANMLKYIRITASSNFGNIFSIVLASAFLPFLPMTALQLLLLNLLYDILCMTLPWDRVDADVYEKPSEWSGKTLGRFMRFFGPLSSLFDLATFAFLYFILCPALLGDNFTELSSAMQSQFAILFHTGWFLESMWTQVLILHLLRTKQLSILRSRASGVVWLVTSAGLLILTAIVYTPAAHLLGLAPLPLWYFGFLAVTILAYMLLVTAAKRWYIQKYHTLL